MAETKFLNRPPRLQLDLPSGTIPIPNPPRQGNGTSRLNMLTLALPLVTILGYSLVSGRSSNILLMLPMGIGVILTSTVAFLNWRRTQEVEAQTQARYTATLEQLRLEMEKKHSQQRAFYNRNLPSPEEILQMAARSEPSPRLWERRPEDEDFGMLRLGAGRVPSTVTFQSPSGDNNDAPQLGKAIRLAREFDFLDESPIAVSLRKTHAIGITGQNYAQVTDVVRSMLVHLCGLHSPNEVRLHIIGEPQSQSQWNWARWLSHCNVSHAHEGAGEQLSFDRSRDELFWEEIQTDLERRQMHRESISNASEANTPLPLHVVVIDLFTTVNSPLNQVTSEASVATILNHGRELGAAIVFLVPEFKLIPSECTSVVTITSDPNRSDVLFDYSETGVNGIRRDGKADRMDTARAEREFGQKLKSWDVRTIFGSDLPKTLTTLDLQGVSSVDDLPIQKKWAESCQPTREWPQVTFGMMIGNKPATLLFEQNVGSGVHGLVAGTTGTGKSQLLKTLIIGLAANYDPSIVNFVLVDYKGGTTFESLRELPHTVDVITNLHGQAGNRAFTAMRAELNRRNDILRDASVDDIGQYHERDYHNSGESLPHLFIIIDEFAQMLKERPEFKDQLDTIARLGRSAGVHLILATQRPSGVVSEQIRANIKFRICLRVETADDSRELLGRTDAFFLPPNIPGRAYLQVGNENVSLVQVAQVGEVYRGQEVDTQPPVIWLKKQSNAPANQFETLADVIAKRSRQLLNDQKRNPPQKPWPDPLPEAFPLSKLLEPIHDWLGDNGRWAGIDWKQNAMRAVIGLLDKPSEAQQTDLVMDMTQGHVVVFGTSGSGKSTFIRTVVTSLTATHSPQELHIYALDFGGRSLDVFQSLPHWGASITPIERERVGRLLRWSSNQIEGRKVLFSKAQVSTLNDYNAANPGAIQPAILLIVDNFAEFRENYSDDVESFISLARDGRAYGFHILISAEQVTAVQAQVYSLFTERIALKLADSSEYSSIVGRSVPDVGEIPGRGFIRRDRTVFEFQTASPVSLTTDEDDFSSENSRLISLCQKMSAEWQDRPRPEPIQILPPIISLKTIPPTSPVRRMQAIIGRQDSDLRAATVDLKDRGPHFVITGPPVCGKTNALRAITLSLAAYPPDQVELILVDYQQRFYQYGGQRSLAELPQVRKVISETAGLTELAESLKTDFTSNTRRAASTVVLIDNFDDWLAFFSNNRALATTLAELTRKYGPDGLHFVAAVSSSNYSGAKSGEFFKQIDAARYGLGLDSSEAPVSLGARMRSGQPQEFPPGRGFIVKSGRISLIQVATPQQDDLPIEESLDQWVASICERFPKPVDV
jgi:type VII secretion EssC-like protein